MTPAGRLARKHPGATAPRAIGRWLLVCCAMLFALIVIGGVTRLTHSGLSITEWQPLIGTLPPLTDAQWAETFAKYQQTPEYQKVNRGMSLEAFKGIFWWEYVHRLVARSLGLVFLLPLLWFVIRRRVDAALAWKLGAIFVLGAAQGAMGWYMVQSGLVDNPRVSHLRLTAHLGLAFVIFAAMFWVALDLLRGAGGRDGATRRAGAPQPHARVVPPRNPEAPLQAGDAWPRGGSDASLARLAAWLAVLVFVQVLSGGMVAGIRAGFAYNTFPLMAGSIIPPGILMLDPWYMNLVNNVATIQFVHRAIAWLLIVAVPVLWWHVRRAHSGTAAGNAAAWLLAAMVLQFALGVATLMLIVPLPLAAVHQAGALLVLAAAVNLAHALRADAGASAYGGSAAHARTL